MNRLRVALCAIAIAVIVRPQALLAQPPRGVVSGVVANAAGEPQPTITVILTAGDGGLERRAVTDAAGSFVFG